MVLAALLIVTACAGPTPVPTTEAPQSAPPTTPASERELRLGQTFGLVYDPEIERVVLVNGAQESGPAKPTELWTWDGTAWGLLDDSGPEARSYGSVARDPERGVVIVHGGMSSSGVRFDETLEWDGETWTTAAAGDEGPGDREGAGLAWDPATNRMLLFGGASNEELPPETWSWSGTDWTQVADSGPRSRFVNLMADDHSGDGGVLLQGGHWVEGDGGGNLDDTWHWDGEAWTEVTQGAGTGPGQRVNSQGAWDERLVGIVMFGGGQGPTPDTGTNDTWLWTTDDGWTQLDTPTAPSQRNAHGLAFDSKRQVLVLVWELGADGWREVMAPS